MGRIGQHPMNAVGREVQHAFLKRQPAFLSPCDSRDDDQWPVASAWGVVRTIESAFEAEGFECGPAVDSGGVRRSLFDSYTNVIDWKDPGAVARAVRVFEEMISWPEDNEYTAKTLQKLRRLFEYDGYTIDDDRRIRLATIRRATQLPLEELRDPSAINEHLHRLDQTGDADPPLAISASKSLVEATCKHVLEELGVTYDDRAEIPELVREVQRALKVHPDNVAPTAKGRETIVRTLSNLSQLVIGIAELRNEYGPDHGRTRPTSGIGPRHAHLAVGAAQTYCRFLLETLRERRT